MDELNDVGAARKSVGTIFHLLGAYSWPLLSLLYAGIMILAAMGRYEFSPTAYLYAAVLLLLGALAQARAIYAKRTRS